jgi:serine/threonine-protein kinase
MDLKAKELQQEERPMVCPTGLEIFPSGHTFCPQHKVPLTEQQLDSLVGQVLNDRYLVKEAISAGGWASIYRAIDQHSNQELAIKILHSHLLSDTEALARFKRESKATGGLEHPYLAKILDAGVLADGQPYLTMEYVHGMTLAERLLTLGPLTAEQAVAVFEKVCDALSAAHKHGIIHRDIKPSNLMLTQVEKDKLAVKLVDFGLARAIEKSGNEIDQITRSGQTLGSPGYMSPEQCLGYKLDPRSDIYSLGCTMYEAVSGKPPFVALSILEYMHKHTYEEPPTLEIRSDEANFAYNLAHVILQSLEKNPDDRQQSMQQLQEQLKACVWQGRDLSELPTPTSKERIALPSAQQAPPTVHRARAWLAVLIPVMLPLILVCIFVYVVRQGQHSLQPQPQQSAAATKPSTIHKGHKRP